MTDQLSRQEADRMLAAALSASQERWEAHVREHAHHSEVHQTEHDRDREMVRVREEALEKAFAAHQSEHAAHKEAVHAALGAHEQRHEDQAEQVRRSDAAMDRRLEALNGVYSQMREQAQRFASAESVQLLQAQVDRRFDETRRERDLAMETLRGRVEALEKTDVKGEGRQIGQGATIALIVGAVTFVGTILGIILVIANFLTRGA